MLAKIRFRVVHSSGRSRSAADSRRNFRLAQQVRVHAHPTHLPDAEPAVRSCSFVLFALLMPSCDTARPGASAQSTKPDLESFAATLDSLRLAAQIPGLSAVVVQDGTVIFARGFGYANLERRIPATPETPFNIASVTKPISAVVALRLVEQGMLDLDRPMAQYSEWADFCRDFSEQPSMFAHGLRCDPPGHTLRHLLTHTAIGTPGAHFSYNPVLYSWASRPMRDAAGTPFSQLTEQHVFRPAGMQQSARQHRELPLRSDLAEALAVPYRIDSTGQVVRAEPPSPQGDGAAGGVIATAMDLAKFDIALEGGQLLSAASYTQLMQPTRAVNGDTLPYSLGWFSQTYDGHELRWHSGWWEDAYSALYLKVLDQELTLILLANSEGLWWDNPLDSAQVELSVFADAFFHAFR